MALSLHRLIRLLCLLLLVLTCSLVYVIQNALITDTMVIKKRPNLQQPLSLRRPLNEQEGQGLATVTGSSLDTMFRSLDIGHCGYVERIMNNSVSSSLWKPLNSTKANVLLTSAYLDARTVFANVSYRFVRVLGMKRGRAEPADFYCHFYLKGTDEHYRRPLISVKAAYSEIWVSAWHPQPTENTFHSIMVHCPVPLAHGHSGATESVDLSEVVIVSSKGCDLDAEAGVALPIIYGKKEEEEKSKKDFCVCVKPLDFPDQPKLAERLIEWIEVNRLLGAAKIVIYVYTVHERAMRVLRHYERQGLVEVRPWELPGHLPNDSSGERSAFLRRETWQRRRIEILPYNQCFYDNMNDFRFVVPLDIDEIILPTVHNSWSDMLDRVLFKQRGLLDRVASFAAQNVYFFRDWDLDEPGEEQKSTASKTLKSSGVSKTGGGFFDVSIFAFGWRCANFSRTGHGVKSFVNTNVAVSLFNHYALSVVHPGQTFVLNLKPDWAQLNHYKENCFRALPQNKKQCREDFLPYRVRDERLAENFRPRVIENAKEIWRDLDI